MPSRRNRSGIADVASQLATVGTHWQLGMLEWPPTAHLLGDRDACLDAGDVDSCDGGAAVPRRRKSASAALRLARLSLLLDRLDVPDSGLGKQAPPVWVVCSGEAERGSVATDEAACGVRGVTSWLRSEGRTPAVRVLEWPPPQPASLRPATAAGGALSGERRRAPPSVWDSIAVKRGSVDCVRDHDGVTPASEACGSVASRSRSIVVGNVEPELAGINGVRVPSGSFESEHGGLLCQPKRRRVATPARAFAGVNRGFHPVRTVESEEKTANEEKRDRPVASAVARKSPSSWSAFCPSKGSQVADVQTSVAWPHGDPKSGWHAGCEEATSTLANETAGNQRRVTRKRCCPSCVIFLQPPRSAADLAGVMRHCAPVIGVYMLFTIADRDAAAPWLVPLWRRLGQLLPGQQRFELDRNIVPEVYSDVFVVVMETVLDEAAGETCAVERASEAGDEANATTGGRCSAHRDPTPSSAKPNKFQRLASLRLPAVTTLEELREELQDAGVVGASVGRICTASGRAFEENTSLGDLLPFRKTCSKRTCRQCMGRSCATCIRGPTANSDGNPLVLVLTRAAAGIRTRDVVYLKAHTCRHIDVDQEGSVRAQWSDWGDWQAFVIDTYFSVESLTGGCSSDVASPVDTAASDGSFDFGDVIEFGDAICLRHVSSGAYLSVADGAEGEVVTAEASRGGHAFIVERHGVCRGTQSDGTQVRAGDSIVLRSCRSGRLVDVSPGGHVRSRWDHVGDWQRLVIEKPHAGLPPRPWHMKLSGSNGWQVVPPGEGHEDRWTLHVLPSLAATPAHELTVIFFHALNSHHALDGRDDLDWLRLPDGCFVRLVCPVAPKRRVSSGWGFYADVNGEAHAYHDLIDLLSVWIDVVDAVSLLAARRQLRELVEVEGARLNGRHDRIVLAGHSHGACFALDGLLSSPRRLGGAIIGAGHVLTAPHVPPAADPLASSSTEAPPNAATPIFMINGIEDDVYPPAMVRRDVARLRAAGYSAVTRRTVAGSGHHIDEDVHAPWWNDVLSRVAAAAFRR
eukprot:TRINITY_DN25842_c0_g1_i1.p1 TRINITY_DN25842_c0_g1~~TRINITY_DN25842_c0_g1_i1.p1  ORF type:complete len:1086 (-),score=175.02 TRINITY_DN25842_c0_g1_i1:278-3367(-)